MGNSSKCHRFLVNRCILIMCARNLEKDLVDEMTGPEVYPVGSIQAVDLESMYTHSILGSFNFRLLDLHSIWDTLSQIMSGGARQTSSDGGLSVGLHLLQKHAVKLNNDQTIVSELKKLQYPSATTRTFLQKSILFSPQLRNFQRITHLGTDSRFSELEDENAVQSQC
jgi:hypothetical protein